MPIPEFAPRKAGAVVVLTDVTEFVRLDELRSELIGVASHELNSPLTALRMNLLMLGEGTTGLTPRQQQLLTAAAQGCEERIYSVEELRDLTAGLDRYRWDIGTVRAKPLPVPITYLLGTPAENAAREGPAPDRGAVAASQD